MNWFKNLAQKKLLNKFTNNIFEHQMKNSTEVHRSKFWLKVTQKFFRALTFIFWAWRKRTRRKIYKMRKIPKIIEIPENPGKLQNTEKLQNTGKYRKCIKTMKVPLSIEITGKILNRLIIRKWPLFLQYDVDSIQIIRG